MNNKIRDEWARYESMVLEQRLVQHPELRNEAREAFAGGAAAMYRVFCEEISSVPSVEHQRRMVQDLGDQLRAYALEVGRK